MKVMGSAVLAFEVIVLGLVMPVAHVVYGYELATVVWVTIGLSILCILGIGAMRRDNRTAVVTGSVIQILVLVSGIFIKPFLVPAILFGLIWVLAVVLNSRISANSSTQQSDADGKSDASETP